MSKKATEFQREAMSRMYRGKEIFKPLNTGWIDENVACVREWVANIFFYRKGDTTIMAVVVISRIDHNGRIAFVVEEDVRHPFAHAGNILVDPAGVQRLEDFLAPVHPAHCFSLKFRCLFDMIAPHFCAVTHSQPFLFL